MTFTETGRLVQVREEVRGSLNLIMSVFRNQLNIQVELSNWQMEIYI